MCWEQVMIEPAGEGLGPVAGHEYLHPHHAHKTEAVTNKQTHVTR